MIFFSSDGYFEEIYKAALKSKIEIELLVTEPPKQSGRGRVICRNNAHQFALERGINTLSPENLDHGAAEKIKELINSSVDRVGFVFSYGKIIPEELIKAFSGNIFNLHPSLLPRYRGATPLQSALLDGAAEIGYSVIKVIDRLDAGDIVFSKRIDFSDKDDYRSIMEKIISNFCNNLSKIINIATSRNYTPEKQDEADATYTKKFTKEDGQIKNSDTPESALKKIRAFCVWPKAHIITSDDERVIIHKAHMQNGKLVIDIIQKQSGKPMAFSEFKKGNQTLLTELPDFVRIYQ